MTAKQLKQARQKIGLTQQALAHELGVSIATVSRWETETMVVPKMVEVVMDLLISRTGNRARAGRQHRQRNRKHHGKA